MIFAFFSKEHIWKTILIAVLTVTFAWLGMWQLSRLEERKVANRHLRESLDAPAFSLNEQQDELTELIDFQAKATGSFDYEYQFVLLDRPGEYGDMGSKLVAPFVLEGTNQAILVDRGWISQQLAVQDSHSELDQVLSEVSGRLQKSDSVPSGMIFETAQYRWRRIAIPILQNQIPYELLPVYLQQAPLLTDDLVQPLSRFNAPYDLSNGSHLGYAIQWFCFLAIFLVGYIFYMKKILSE